MQSDKNNEDIVATPGHSVPPKGNNVKESFKNIDSHFSEIFREIFLKSNVLLLAAFLIIYLVVFLISTAVFGSGWSSTIFDITVISVGLFYGLYQFRSVDIGSNTFFLDVFQPITSFFEDPIHVFSTTLFVICFYLVSSFFYLPIGETRPLSLTMFEIILWIVLAVLILHNGLKYFFDINLIKDASLWKYRDPNDGINNATPLAPQPKEEVFNIGNNLYTYDDAQAICKLHNSRLATYDEVEKAYHNGAEWCNYGWSADQMAFFPTQKNTWEELQQSSKHKNNCGRPGVNGGYFDNPELKFGANCFGYKPQPTESEMNMLETKKDRPYPKTEEEQKMEEKIEYWKNNGGNKVFLNSFNREKWSRY